LGPQVSNKAFGYRYNEEVSYGLFPYSTGDPFQEIALKG